MIPESDQETTEGGLSIRDLLARLPLTADGVPILLGDTVWVENEDTAYFGPDAILELKVECLSVGTSFDEYKGTVTVCGPDLECGNLDCYANKETLRGILGANSELSRPQG
jgi:hypothetical protein